MKKYFVLALTVVLLAGCTFPKNAPEGKEVRISNKYSTGDVYFPQSSIVSDNATHLIISIDKRESAASIRYFNFKE